MKCMQTNGYGLFNSPMLSKSIASAYSDTKNTTKNMKRIIPMLSFTTEETKKKKREICEVLWPLVVTLQFDASYFHWMKTLNYNSS